MSPGRAPELRTIPSGAPMPSMTPLTIGSRTAWVTSVCPPTRATPASATAAWSSSNNRRTIDIGRSHRQQHGDQEPAWADPRHGDIVGVHGDGQPADPFTRQGDRIGRDHETSRLNRDDSGVFADRRAENDRVRQRWSSRKAPRSTGPAATFPASAQRPGSHRDRPCTHCRTPQPDWSTRLVEPDWSTRLVNPIGQPDWPDAEVIPAPGHDSPSGSAVSMTDGSGPTRHGGRAVRPWSAPPGRPTMVVCASVERRGDVMAASPWTFGGQGTGIGVGETVTLVEGSTFLRRGRSGRHPRARGPGAVHARYPSALGLDGSGQRQIGGTAHGRRKWAVLGDVRRPGRPRRRTRRADCWCSVAGSVEACARHWRFATTRPKTSPI